MSCLERVSMLGLLGPLSWPQICMPVTCPVACCCLGHCGGGLAGSGPGILSFGRRLRLLRALHKVAECIESLVMNISGKPVF